MNPSFVCLVLAEYLGTIALFVQVLGTQLGHAVGRAQVVHLGAILGFKLARGHTGEVVAQCIVPFLYQFNAVLDGIVKPLTFRGRNVDNSSIRVGDDVQFEAQSFVTGSQSDLIVK